MAYEYDIEPFTRPLSRAQILKAQKDKKEYLDRLVPKLKQYEGFRGKTYIPTKGDVPTIGYGHTGKHAKPGATMTEPEASALLREEAGERERDLIKMTPSLYELDPVTQTALGASQYRGSWGGSPKARRLFNEGDQDAAAKEFLNNKEYKTAVSRGRPGIRPRMEHTAGSLRGAFTGPGHLMFSK